MKNQIGMNPLRGFVAWMLCLSALVFATSAAATHVELQRNDAQVKELELTVGKSHVIYSKVPIREVMLGDPSVADFKLLTNQKMLILGLKSGRTNLLFRDSKGGIIGLFDLEVGYDVEGIKNKLHVVMPDEKGIEVRSSNNKVIMSGQASNLLVQDKALTLARTFVSDDKDVINLMGVGGSQQVMLSVRIAEVARKSGRALGARFSAEGVTGDLALSLATAGTIPGSFGKLTAGGSDVSATLSALATQGLAKILAEPNLVALSGSEAKFLAGGEIPLLQRGGLGVPDTFTYKEFGVAVNFTPTVLNDRRISLKLAAESSDIDLTKGTVAGAPAITTRRAATTVELGDGQGFAIAGLLQNNMNNAVNRLPGLGEIPVLGALFQSTDFQRNETELVIVVVPRLVKPVPANQLVLPTDNLVPPNEIDQYFNGRLEGSRATPAAAGGTGPATSTTDKPQGLEGPYGHQL